MPKGRAFVIDMAIQSQDANTMDAPIRAVKNEVCKSRGGKRTCAIQDCDRSVKQACLCQYHYRCLLCIKPVELEPAIESVMLLFGFEVLEYDGMTQDKGLISAIDRWDYVFAVGLVCVCKSWRASSVDYIN